MDKYQNYLRHKKRLTAIIGDLAIHLQDLGVSLDEVAISDPDREIAVHAADEQRERMK